MTTESDFIEQLRGFAKHPAARGLNDDVAILAFGRHKVIFTQDMMVEGVHFLPETAPADVAWKLLAVNLSDLASKGAKPLGVLMSYGLRGDKEWDVAFTKGLEEALAHYQVPLLGGDTVSLPENAPRCPSMTAIGEAHGHIVPSRSGAFAGDLVYVTGSIGDGWAGLQVAIGECDARGQSRKSLLNAYNRPVPQILSGRKLCSLVTSMMDVSDGLLLDAERISSASEVSLDIDIGLVPLSEAFIAEFGDNVSARLAAATGGDDYQLLFTARVATVLPVPATRIGTVKAGTGLTLSNRGQSMILPGQLGHLHGE